MPNELNDAYAAKRHEELERLKYLAGLGQLHEIQRAAIQLAHERHKGPGLHQITLHTYVARDTFSFFCIYCMSSFDIPALEACANIQELEK